MLGLTVIIVVITGYSILSLLMKRGREAYYLNRYKRSEKIGEFYVYKKIKFKKVPKGIIVYDGSLEPMFINIIDLLED